MTAVSPNFGDHKFGWGRLRLKYCTLFLPRKQGKRIQPALSHFPFANCSCRPLPPTDKPERSSSHPGEHARQTVCLFGILITSRCFSVPKTRTNPWKALRSESRVLALKPYKSWPAVCSSSNARPAMSRPGPSGRRQIRSDLLL